ncbi:MAG TPA: arsenite efflux transporter metallochaperone ArsD [Longimicrobiales bacterium]|nr:arsenite efflux transporter metallochaperone ArsD [Longimicrobiales bacterium]
MVLQVYDPAMCCSTGVCGPDVDQALVRFAVDLDWLQKQGVSVERYNAAHDAGVFVGNPVVRRALQEQGSGCLPLVLWGGDPMASGGYPDRATLARTVGLPPAATSTDGAP